MIKARMHVAATLGPSRQLAVLLLVGVLGACGGDDNPGMSPGGGPSGEQMFPPATATASNDGLIQFILQLVSGNNETDTPSELTAESLPADEASTPADI